MMSSAQYGHVIKHLEVSHLNALPIPDIEEQQRDYFQTKVFRLLEMRNRAVDLTREGERLLAETVGPLGKPSSTLGFSVASSHLFSTRRRLEATFHSPAGQAILEAYGKRNLKVESLSDVTERVWWLTRFKRVFGEGGMPYLSSDELFSVNPPVTKRVMVEQAEAPDDYFVKAGWIMMACSGQTYGLNGSVALLDERHESRFFSHDIVRIVPDRRKIRPGYLYAVLGHPLLGRPLVIRNAYGTSIPHLDPSDVATIPVVRLDMETENHIADLMEEAAGLRAEADDLETEVGAQADQVIEEFVHHSHGTA